MGLLPAYLHKIETLVLAQRYTPGQVHAFFSAYPSFHVFKHLRKLYLEIDMNGIEPRLFVTTLGTISNMALHTLSIKISRTEDLDMVENALMEIFRMKTLRKLSLDYIALSLSWSSLRENSSEVEYLKVRGTSCQPEDLRYIFRWAPRLRYLDIKLQLSPYRPVTTLLSSLAIPPLSQMPMLHTVLLDIEEYSEECISELDTYFRCMPSLSRLEVKIVTDAASSISMWESLIQNVSSSLKSFVLTFKNTKRMGEPDVSSLMLAETPFWTEKQHFHVILKNTLQQCVFWDYLVDTFNTDEQKWDEIVWQWYTGPNCEIDENSTVYRRITNIALHSRFLSQVEKYHLNNVQHLVIIELDDRLLKWIAQHINCSGIQHLHLSPVKTNILYYSLLETTTNISSLGISLQQLNENTQRPQRTYPTVRDLDISSAQHSFNEKDISMISRTFPHLEHLIIRTDDLQYIPLLHTYLPHLHSLTFFSAPTTSFGPFDQYEEDLSYDSLRHRTRFLFRRKGNWITIWIDQAALADSYWLMKDNTIRAYKPNSRSLKKRVANKITSLFK